MIADQEFYSKLLAAIGNTLTSSEIHAIKPLLRNSIFVESLNQGGFLYRDTWNGSEVLSKIQLGSTESIVRLIKKLQSRLANFGGTPYQRVWACKTYVILSPQNLPNLQFER